MAKVYFLNQAESFMLESFISQLHCNENKKTRMKVLYLGSNENKNSGKELNMIGLRFAEVK